MHEIERALVVAAHPDDEVLGCGGSIARLSERGARVTVVIVAEGITSRQEQRDAEEASEDLGRLKGQAHAASKLLGAEQTIFLGMPDNRLDSVDLLDVVKAIERKADALQPQVVFTHWRSDLNIDHVVVNRAVHTAFRPLPGSACCAILEWETLSSTEWSTGRTAFQPNVFIDIEASLERKIEAMAYYQEEVRSYPHPRSPEAITALARLRGSSSGLRAAEAFVLDKMILGAE